MSSKLPQWKEKGTAHVASINDRFAVKTKVDKHEGHACVGGGGGCYFLFLMLAFNFTNSSFDGGASGLIVDF